MRAALKPILIHCKAGADRTGLAAAIYISRVALLDENDATAQLSIRYGHIGIPYSSASQAIGRTWKKLSAAENYAVASAVFTTSLRHP